MSKVPEIINQVDCLVLPSLHDGWGAVTSESLMVGTPVICSDACGSSIVVKASKVGGIFLSNNQKILADILHIQYKTGKICIRERQKIARWARCLGAKSGAKYLEQILNNKDKNLTKELSSLQSSTSSTTNAAIETAEVKAASNVAKEAASGIATSEVANDVASARAQVQAEVTIELGTAKYFADELQEIRATVQKETSMVPQTIDELIDELKNE